MSTRRFRRATRLAVPPMPQGEIDLEPPPEINRPAPRNVAFAVLPVVMILSSVGFVFIGGFSATSMMMGGMMAVSTVGMMAGGGGRTGSRRGQTDQDRTDYLRYLAHVRTSMQRTRDAQRASTEWQHPHPRALAAMIPGRRTWERRRTHRDFLRVRVACGPQRLAVRIAAPRTGPIDELDPTSAVALRRLVRGHSLVPDLPIAVQLRAFAAVGVDGDSSRDLVRAMLAELITFHAPDDVRLAVVADGPRRAEWEWVKWVPHAQHPTRTDAAGPVRLVASSLGEVEDWLAPELEGRGRFTRTATLTDGPHVVIVVDGGRVGADSKIMTSDGLVGVTVIDLSGAVGALSARRGIRLDVDAGRVGARSSRGVEPLGRLDGLTAPEAEAVARRLAPLRLGGAADRADEPLVAATELTELLGIRDAGRVAPGELWRPRAVRDRMRVPIGVTDRGEPVELDLKEAALDGMGPHGLVIGATGSGKSEVLRTVVLGLAATHSSEILNLVLIDFKGGATFAGLQRLPHTAAVITNLADDLTLVDRMRDALAGEMNRRQELLRAAGNVANVRDYEALRERGADLPALPALVIVCDEFSELLSQKPDFTELFVAIGRLGRSLSMHLLLASQRLEEGRLRGLDSHLSYRIGLKTFSAAESRAVLGVVDAYELPPLPGSGFLKYDTTSMVRFKAAYVSGAYRPVGGADDIAATVGSFGIRPFRADFVAAPQPTADLPAATATAESVLDVMVERFAGQGPPAHNVWLPPLDDAPTLDQLLPALEVTAERGLSVPDFAGNGSLQVPVAIIDKPYEQRRETLTVDLAGAAGNVAVVGGPQSGKSTALRTLLAALALTHTPVEAQAYVVDLGGGALSSIADLPHVGVVAGRQDTELVRRTVAELTALLTRREQEFRARGIDSAATFRIRRAAGQVDDRYGDVFLVIDGWATFRQEFEDLEAAVVALAGQGLSYGIHVVLSAPRWADIRPAVRDQIATRLELRLGDPSESEIDRRSAANVPIGRAGRGLAPSHHQLLMALPRVDSRPGATDLAAGVADLVERVRAGWGERPPAPRVRLLPARLSVDELPAARDPRGIPFGVDESDLAPVYLDVEADPHFVVFGDSESGKSTFLRVIARGIAARYPAERARILAVDYRRSLLDEIPPEHLAGYAVSAPAAGALFADLRTQLEARLPGPDVTPEQLRTRSWWTGREVFVLVDDYDLVATASGNPLAALLDLLPQSRDIGLHIVLCRRSGGAGRALFEPVLQRIKELGAPGLLLSGSRDEGVLLGQSRPAPMPPGRGTLVRRRGASDLVQVAYLPR